MLSLGRHGFPGTSSALRSDPILPSCSAGCAGCDNPQELLAAARFQALMDFCMREFEATVVDTPAANFCADARFVSAPVIGYSLIVARRNASWVWTT